MDKDFLDERRLLGVLYSNGRILARLLNPLMVISVYPRLDFQVSERFRVAKKPRISRRNPGHNAIGG